MVDISERVVGGALIGHSPAARRRRRRERRRQPARVPVRRRSVQRLRQHEGPDAPEDGLSVRTRLIAMGVAALAATLVLLFGGVLRRDKTAIASSALPAGGRRAAAARLRGRRHRGARHRAAGGAEGRRATTPRPGARSVSPTNSGRARPATRATTARPDGALHRALTLQPRRPGRDRRPRPARALPPPFPRRAARSDSAPARSRRRPPASTACSAMRARARPLRRRVPRLQPHGRAQARASRPTHASRTPAS